MNLIIQQAIYYGIVILITILVVGIYLKGFLGAYLKVRMSFGKYVFVKVRTVLRDYFTYGYIEEGFLIFKHKKELIRIAVNPSDRIFYRCLSILWIDLDEEKNAICKTDYTTTPGFDSKKFSDLITRALQRPTIASGQEKLILLLVIIAIVAALGALYIGYLNYQNTQFLKLNLPTMINGITTKLASLTPTVTPSVI